MKTNNFAVIYELLLDLNPNYFDDYSDPDQRLDVFIHESTRNPVELFANVAHTILSIEGA